MTSPASAGIKQRLASLGGGFNPLLINQSPTSKLTPTAAAAATAAAAHKDADAGGSEDDAASFGPLRKPSIVTNRRQASITLPQFTPLSPPASERAETAPLAPDGDEAEQQQEKQQQSSAVSAAHQMQQVGMERARSSGRRVRPSSRARR